MPSAAEASAFVSLRSSLAGAKRSDLSTGKATG
jgi:hypothetical protein